MTGPASASPELIGSARQPGASGALAPLAQPPAARIAVLVDSDIAWRATAGWIADDLTTVVRYGGLAELEADERPDVVVADRSALADLAELLRCIRRRWLTTFIVVVDALDDADVAALLDAGADDAVVVGSPQLPARLHAASRRAHLVNAGARIAIGDVVFDRESHRMWCAGREIELTRTEEAVVACLFWHAPHAVSLSALTAFVWGGEVTTARRNLAHVYIGYLRNKLSTSRKVVIRTVRGVGYGLAARDTPAATVKDLT